MLLVFVINRLMLIIVSVCCKKAKHSVSFNTVFVERNAVKLKSEQPPAFC